MKQVVLLVLLAVIGFASASETKQGNVPYGQAYGQQRYAPSYPSYPYPPAPPRQTRRRGGSSMFMMMMFLLLSQSSPKTTTATTADPGTCAWGAWSACSATCQGTKLRVRTCAGSQETDHMECNGPEFRPNGWYRAANCYEYSWRLQGTGVNRATAVTECANLNAKLASKGMRNDTIRRDVLQKIYDKQGNQGGFGWIGVTDEAVEGTWVWSDDVTAQPTFWTSGAPDTPPGGDSKDCGAVILGSATSLTDQSCLFLNDILCERKS